MELLARILAAAEIGETTDWEFKSARGGFPGSFWETYSAFLMIGCGEKAGSGFDRIQSEWLAHRWRAPALTTQSQPDRVRLELPMVSLFPEQAITDLEHRFGMPFDHLTSIEVQALVTAYLETFVTNTRLQELCNNHPAELTQILQNLCKNRFLVSDNRGLWTRYRLLPTLSPGTPHTEVGAGHTEAGAGHTGTGTPYTNPTLAAIAQPLLHNKRASQVQIRETLVQLCRGRFLTLEQLARLLQRHPRGLRNRYLTPLVSQGILQKRFPNSPNRPDQAYTAPPL